MRFFIDAQLPYRLCSVFENAGHTAQHARDLPKGYETTDNEILELLDFDIVVVSKDSDFYHSALIRSLPRKLVYLRKVLLRYFDLKQKEHSQLLFLPLRPLWKALAKQSQIRFSSFSEKTTKTKAN
ncbi:MAG: DUF5615 family PIN-like protein [Bacteroidota bacterium]